MRKRIPLSRLLYLVKEREWRKKHKKDILRELSISSDSDKAVIGYVRKWSRASSRYTRAGARVFFVIREMELRVFGMPSFFLFSPLPSF